MAELLSATLPEKIEAAANEIKARMAAAGPLEVLLQASLAYSLTGSAGPSDDKNAAHVEWLALLALMVGIEDQAFVDPRTVSAATQRCLDLAKAAFSDAMLLSFARGMSAENSKSPSGDLVSGARRESMAVRGSGYVQHLSTVLEGVTASSASSFDSIVGLSGSAAVKCFLGVRRLIEQRFNARMQQGIQAANDFVVSEPTDGDGKKQIEAALIAWVFMDPRAICRFDASSLSETSSVSAPEAEAFLRLLECDPSSIRAEHHTIPSGMHPIVLNPLIRFEDCWFAPSVTSLIDAVRPRLEDALAQKAPQLAQRYYKQRANYLESSSAKLIADCLPGSAHEMNVQWTTVANKGDKPSSSGEVDGLVFCDDVVLILQCKAGRMSAPARRGAPGRMKTDVESQITEAASQHRAFRTALSEHGSSGLCLPPEVARRLAEAQLIFDVVVCLDDVTPWATESYLLANAGFLDATGQLPWVVSLTDLMAVTELLSGTQFVHYLTRRARLETQGLAQAHDELDWVGNYLDGDLWFDHLLVDERPDRLMLLSHTAAIDQYFFAQERGPGSEMPRRKLPDSLRALISDLESQRPSGWLRCAVAFMDGDQQVLDDIDTRITPSWDRAATVGWTGPSVLFGSGGISFCCDRMNDPVRALIEFRARCEYRLTESGSQHWHGVLRTSDGHLSAVNLVRRPFAPSP